MTDILIERETFATRFSLGKPGANEAGRFKALCSVFGSIVDTTAQFGFRTRFREGAFRKTISDRAQRVKVMSNHDDRSIPIGLPTSMSETKEGLVIEASLNKTQLGLDWMAMIRHAQEIGHLSDVELSIGFDAVNFEMVCDDDDQEELREITEARLWEVSLVMAGADRGTRMLEAASLNHRLRDEHLLVNYETYRQASMRALEKAEADFAETLRVSEEITGEYAWLNYYERGGSYE